MGFTKRPFDTSISLSVHGLLLVDALQTFGPDFELLIASHKHVGLVYFSMQELFECYCILKIIYMFN